MSESNFKRLHSVGHLEIGQASCQCLASLECCSIILGVALSFVVFGRHRRSPGLELSSELASEDSNRSEMKLLLLRSMMNQKRLKIFLCKVSIGAALPDQFDHSTQK